MVAFAVAAARVVIRKQAGWLDHTYVKTWIRSLEL